MKNYFNANTHDWLDGLLPDLITDLLQPTMDPGYVYAPFIPEYKTPTFIDPNDFTMRKGIRTRIKNKTFKSVKVSQLDPGAAKRRVAQFAEILSAVQTFASRKPAEAPKGVLVMNTDVSHSLERLHASGVLHYDVDERGWWRPEILDALAAMGDGNKQADP